MVGLYSEHGLEYIHYSSHCSVQHGPRLASHVVSGPYIAKCLLWGSGLQLLQYNGQFRH